LGREYSGCVYVEYLPDQFAVWARAGGERDDLKNRHDKYPRHSGKFSFALSRERKRIRNPVRLSANTFLKQNTPCTTGVTPAFAGMT
jgi:hypothetical protein